MSHSVSLRAKDEKTKIAQRRLGKMDDVKERKMRWFSKTLTKFFIFNTTKITLSSADSESIL